MKFLRMLLILGVALAAAPLFATAPVNKTLLGVAIKGYDPVAYFAEARPVKGSDDFEYKWQGATWRFASAEHRDSFKAEPGKYAPQYGGYCAWAVSRGYTAGIDPDAWKIVEGRLYLNYDRDIQQKWQENMRENITAADANWPKILAE